jgi:hypothetical protein
MIAFTFRNLVLLVLLNPVFNCFSQTDTTLTNEKEPEFVNDKFKERTSMFYFGGNTTLETRNYEFGASSGIYTGYEHKMNKNHVIGAGIGYFFYYQDVSYVDLNSFQYLLRLDLTYKFYHNLNSRMRKGLTGNNFSANYFYVSPNLSFTPDYRENTSYAWDFTNGYWVVTSRKERFCEPALKLGYGFQRVIRNKLNFDMNAGLQFNLEYHYGFYPKELFFLQIRLGFIIK